MRFARILSSIIRRERCPRCSRELGTTENCANCASERYHRQVFSI